jgi:hypothetical protein
MDRRSPLIRNPFDNVGMPAKVRSLNERSPYEPFQRKALNLATGQFF